MDEPNLFSVTKMTKVFVKKTLSGRNSLQIKIRLKSRSEKKEVQVKGFPHLFPIFSTKTILFM